MKILFAIIIALCLMGCQQFQNTVGCYSETEFGIGYERQFGDSSIDGRYASDFSGHGNPKNHSGSSSGSFSGDSFSEDRVATEVRIHFKPGACE